MNKWTITLTAASVLVLALQGCVPAVLVGGAAAGGTVVLTDRRSPGTQLADQNIRSQAQAAVDQVLDGRGHVNVTSYYRKVLITGEVPSQEDLKKVETAVEKTPDVVGVINELSVMPESSLGSRSSDSLITSKVKSRFLSIKGIPSNSIKVVTERGVVYLMGRMTEEERKLATHEARSVDGVKRVVRIIDLISPQDLQAQMASVSDRNSGSTAPTEAVQEESTDAAAPATEGVQVQPVKRSGISLSDYEPVEIKQLEPLQDK